jgi:hypothetical protein
LYGEARTCARRALIKAPPSRSTPPLATTGTPTASALPSATLTAAEIKALVDAGRHVRLPEPEPVTDDTAAELPIDPYFMGLLLAELTRTRT